MLVFNIICLIIWIICFLTLFNKSYEQPKWLIGISYLIVILDILICRQKSNLLVKNGIITNEKCIICGNSKSEKHHPDYNNPKNIVWLCRKHHIELHTKEIKLTKV